MCFNYFQQGRLKMTYSIKRHLVASPVRIWRIVWCSWRINQAENVLESILSRMSGRFAICCIFSCCNLSIIVPFPSFGQAMPSWHAFWDFFVTGFILKLQLDKIPKRLCLQVQATSWPLELSSYCSAYCSQFFLLAVHHANGLVGQRFSRLLFRLPCFWTYLRNCEKFTAICLNFGFPALLFFAENACANICQTRPKNIQAMVDRSRTIPSIGCPRV